MTKRITKPEPELKCPGVLDGSDIGVARRQGQQAVSRILRPGEAILAQTARLRRLARRVDAYAMNVEITLMASTGNGAAIALRSNETSTSWRDGEAMEEFILRHRRERHAKGGNF